MAGVRDGQRSISSFFLPASKNKKSGSEQEKAGDRMIVPSRIAEGSSTKNGDELCTTSQSLHSPVKSTRHKKRRVFDSDDDDDDDEGKNIKTEMVKEEEMNNEQEEGEIEKKTIKDEKEDESSEEDKNRKRKKKKGRARKETKKSDDKRETKVVKQEEIQVAKEGKQEKNANQELKEETIKKEEDTSTISKRIFHSTRKQGVGSKQGKAIKHLSKRKLEEDGESDNNGDVRKGHDDDDEEESEDESLGCMSVKKKARQETPENRHKEGNVDKQSQQPSTEGTTSNEEVSEDVKLASPAFPQEKSKPKADISGFFAPRRSVNSTDTSTKALVGSASSKGTLNRVEPSSNTSTVCSPTDYDPTKSPYHPISHACWACGERVPYMAVARTFEKIEDESARLRIVEMLSNLFRSVVALTPNDILPCIYLCLNRLGPAYDGIELGIGDTVLIKAIAQATGRQVDKVKADVQERGDLGLVAECSRSNQKTMFAPPKLTVSTVYSRLKEIAQLTGHSSMNKKIDVIKMMFVACRHSEARYLIRSLGGKLRIGLAEQSVLAALAQALCLTPGNDVLDTCRGLSADARKASIEAKLVILKQTYCELPNYDIIVPTLLAEGFERLPELCKLTPGIPLKPMLAHPTKGIGEVLKRFDEAEFTCEFKYDGERAQIHVLEDGQVMVFSRNQENNTSKYPDIVGRLKEVMQDHVKSCVLDAEAVAWDRENRQIQPFQVLTTRKRKDVDASEIKVQVCVYAFDLLYLNGESLVRRPLRERRELLHGAFHEREGEFLFARCMVSSSTEDIADFLEQSIRDSCEGLMVKTLDKDATYEIAKRSHNWLKLKKDYLDGVGDTLDLVVIGGYHGKGKRTGTYGGFLLACYDVENEEFQTICKIGTGFKDEDLETYGTFFKEKVLTLPRAYYRWDSGAEPDVWFEPVQVWEVKCADLSISPVYKAALGLVDPEKGISLRFPRFLRIREDKQPEDATSNSQVADLYNKQQQVQNQRAAADRPEGDKETY
uniref:DNA ligase 1 isoform X2 n=1 Tax=Myxine glutinosa TaxID=7769 RepID=UPI00358FB082